MDLVNELQISAESDDVLTVLRKARRLASKLGVDDIDDWLKAEQNGYGPHHEIPHYRTIKGSLCFNTNGPIPVGYGMTGNGIMDYPGGFMVDSPMTEAMGEIIALIDGTASRQHGIYLQVHAPDVLRSLQDTVHPYLANRVTFMLKMSIAQIRAIPEAVKDRILDWACELERRGILGANMTFNDDERERAHAITFNISGSTIEQLNNMGNNFRGQ